MEGCSLIRRGVCSIGLSYVEISPVRPFVTCLWLTHQIFMKFGTRIFCKNLSSKCYENRLSDCHTSLRGVSEFLPQLFTFILRFSWNLIHKFCTKIYQTCESHENRPSDGHISHLGVNEFLLPFFTFILRFSLNSEHELCRKMYQAITNLMTVGPVTVILPILVQLNFCPHFSHLLYDFREIRCISPYDGVKM